MSLKQNLNENSTHEETLLRNDIESINDNNNDDEASEDEALQTDKELSKNLEIRRWFIALMFFFYS